MGYQALLFCPDEKTARSVTQVLSELEFSVEPCGETFAAVKKLMGGHFDAVVVDCDNEQNATLLFKSARNSSSNQASLAVAVVEGQAGVAKAFRIGANLVLTKPINIEQAKGTLRVARGLLRKSESAKPAASAAAAATAPATSAPPKAQVSAPNSPAAQPPVQPPAAPAAKPAAAWPGQPAAAAPSPAREPEPAAPKSSVPSAPKPPAPVVPPAAKIAAPPPAPKLPAPVPAASAPAAAAKAASKPSATPSFGGAAASAPAPARDLKPAPAAAPAAPAADLFETPAAEAPVSANPAPAANPTSFTFGGNATTESGGSKKILLIVAAVVVAAALGYAGWGYFSTHRSAPMSNPATESQPNTSRPAPAMSAPAPVPKAQAPPAPATPAPVVPAANAVTAHNQPASAADDSEDSAAPGKPAVSLSTSAKTAAAKPAPAPLVVKGGSVHGTAKSAVLDAPAPSVIGLAAGAGAPPPDLVASNSGARPVLQRMNISQGVSQGLLIKKVSPVYPPTALRMHIEGAVLLLATISKTGNITDVKVLSGDKQLTQAATDAVKQWKYKPYLLNGDPVEIQTQITINFKMPQ